MGVFQVQLVQDLQLFVRQLFDKLNIKLLIQVLMNGNGVERDV